MMTKAIPQFSGTCARKRSSASNPPAEAPMPTMGICFFMRRQSMPAALAVSTVIFFVFLGMVFSFLDRAISSQPLIRNHSQELIACMNTIMILPPLLFCFNLQYIIIFIMDFPRTLPVAFPYGWFLILYRSSEFPARHRHPCLLFTPHWFVFAHRPEG